MRPSLVLLIAGLAALGSTATRKTEAPAQKELAPMQLGTFSVSLAVKDIAASRAFYEALGFRQIGGDEKQKWLILANDTATIGLFQGMWEKNIMTFNPGWKAAFTGAEQFMDVREIQAALKKKGLKLTTEADEKTSGPASLTLSDQDGNQILLDQHVPSPKK